MEDFWKRQNEAQLSVNKKESTNFVKAVYKGFILCLISILIISYLIT